MIGDGSEKIRESEGRSRYPHSLEYREVEWGTYPFVRTATSSSIQTFSAGRVVLRIRTCGKFFFLLFCAQGRFLIIANYCKFCKLLQNVYKYCKYCTINVQIKLQIEIHLCTVITHDIAFFADNCKLLQIETRLCTQTFEFANYCSYCRYCKLL